MMPAYAPLSAARLNPTAEQIDALSKLVEEHAHLAAEMAINEAYVRLRNTERPELVTAEGLAAQLLEPQVVIDDTMAELIAEHWEHAWQGRLNELLHVQASVDTPGEQAMFERQAEEEFYRLHGLTYPQDRDDRNHGPNLPPTGPADPDRGPDNRGDQDRGR